MIDQRVQYLVALDDAQQLRKVIEAKRAKPLGRLLAPVALWFVNLEIRKRERQIEKIDSAEPPDENRADLSSVLGLIAVVFFTQALGVLAFATLDPTLAGITDRVMMLIPVIYYVRARGNARERLKLNPTSIRAVLAGALIGALLWLPVYVVEFGLNAAFNLPPRLPHVPETAMGMLFWVLMVVIMTPVVEELLFRGAVFTAMLKAWRPRTAIIVSSLLFGLIHLAPGAIVPVALAGMVAAWIVYKADSLYPAIAFHVTYNAVGVIIALVLL